ncbi:NADH-quinone oxidoreductase subunit C [Silanimonas sp.]|uniref:NADH-quinone oxidoreductase subunit C n=1 Tax=Silanimonas sp. TaxID=1929290 RepID=UPI0022BD21F3|nr:NADH-quinone oxidoreductase subunit C [Silanimonas sp.]MCZ8165369.1 NADH-quinone oxidoreductase subunit C [Silanimonas sp.]
MAEAKPRLAERLRARFGERALAIVEAHGETTLEVAPSCFVDVARALRDEPEFHFEQAVDVSGLDFLGYGEGEWETTDVSSEGFSRGVEGDGPGRFRWENRPQGVGPAKRFASVVHLLSIRNNERLRLRTFATDNALPVVPSLVDVWPGLDWFEREAFDLYGIVYEGHPDLRRILTDYGFVGHPFRKDFPLIGNVEVRYDAEKQRVVYEPVTSVEPRVGVPKVVREDSRWHQAASEAAAKKA